MKIPEIFKGKERKEPKPKCTYESHPTWYGKTWHFLAHEDTWLSFLVDAILVILIGKFLIYPAIGFALGTDYPIVAVVSSSMDHHGMNFDAWWAENGKWYEDRNITKEQFETFYKPNGFLKGDVFVVKGVNISDLKVGDIIVYSVAGRSDPIIHRVISTDTKNLATKGDANSDQIPFEQAISPEQIQGKAVAWAPKIGWVKTILVDITNKFR